MAETVDALIERLATEAMAEMKSACDRARDAIDLRLGFSESFIRRSRGQRRRYQRLSQGATTA
jgi:hypothetical protein